MKIHPAVFRLFHTCRLMDGWMDEWMDEWMDNELNRSSAGLQMCLK
jgi:hypothetical protein